MGRGVIDKYDANWIKDEAREAIDFLQAIQKEVVREYPHAYYIREKAEKAAMCIENIASCSLEYMKQIQEEEEE